MEKIDEQLHKIKPEIQDRINGMKIDIAKLDKRQTTFANVTIEVHYVGTRRFRKTFLIGVLFYYKYNFNTDFITAFFTNHQLDDSQETIITFNTWLIHT
jgi:hypothetical protein